MELFLQIFDSLQIKAETLVCLAITDDRDLAREMSTCTELKPMSNSSHEPLGLMISRRDLEHFNNKNDAFVIQLSSNLIFDVLLFFP